MLEGRRGGGGEGETGRQETEGKGRGEVGRQEANGGRRGREETGRQKTDRGEGERQGREETDMQARDRRGDGRKEREKDGRTTDRGTVGGKRDAGNGVEDWKWLSEGGGRGYGIRWKPLTIA